MIIMVFGLPGSGKSFFAEKLTEIIGAAYLSSDQVRKEIAKHPDYSEADKKKVYMVMLGKLEKALADHSTIILDATFYKKSIRQLFVEKAQMMGQQLLFIEIRADEYIIASRVGQKRKYSDADFEVYKKVKEQFESLEEPHLVLQSTNDNIEAMLTEAKVYIESKSTSL